MNRRTLVLLLALLLAAIVGYYWMSLPATDGDSPPVASTAPPPDPRPALGESPSPTRMAAPGHSASADRSNDRLRRQGDPAAVVDRKDAKGKGGSLRLFGTVEDRLGHRLPGILLLWMPYGKPIPVNDFRLTQMDTSAEPPGFLRETLKESHVVRSAADGSYELFLTRPANLGRLVAMSDGYERQIAAVDPAMRTGKPSHEPADARLSRGEDIEIEIDFRLGLGSGMSGRVISADDGKPVEGITIWVTSDDSTPPDHFDPFALSSPAALTDHEGEYRVRGLRPGRYRVSTGSGETSYGPSPEERTRRVVLEAGSEATGIDFEVFAGGEIAARVFDSDRTPIKDAYCYFRFASADNQDYLLYLRMEGAHVGRSNKDGICRLVGVPFGLAVKIGASARGFAEEWAEGIVLEIKRPLYELDFVLDRSGSLSGHVVDVQGTRVTNAFVFLNPLSDSEAPGRSARTDDKGAFQFSGVRLGEYQLGGRLHDMPGKIENIRVSLKKSGERLGGLRLVVEDEGGQSLSGIVVDDRGTPLAGASVYVSGTTQRQKATGADGRFVFERLADGEYTLSAHRSEHTRGVLERIPVGQDDLRLTLSRYGRLSGQVVDRSGPLMASGGSVFARLKDSRPESSVRLDDDGTFDFNAPPGELQIEAVVAGYAPALSDPIQVLPGGEVRGLVVLVERGAAIQGQVTLDDGSPVAGAKVWALWLDGTTPQRVVLELPVSRVNERFTALSDQEGQFEISDLPAGNFDVKALHDRFKPSAPRRIRLLADQLKTLQPLVLTPGGTIEGVVLRGPATVQEAHVTLISSGTDLRRSSFTDALGRFVFEGLEAGSYTVRASESLFSGTVRTQSVELGERAGAVVSFDFDGRRVFGRLSGDQGREALMILMPPDVPAKLSLSEAFWLAIAGMTNSDSQGRFSLSGVRPGHYSLLIYRDSKLVARREIEVRDTDLEVNFVVDSSISSGGP